jgi:hypothetical protein
MASMMLMVKIVDLTRYILRKHWVKIRESADTALNSSILMIPEIPMFW